MNRIAPYLIEAGKLPVVELRRVPGVGPVLLPPEQFATANFAEMARVKAVEAIVREIERVGSSGLANSDLSELWGWRLWRRGGTRLMTRALDDIEAALREALGERAAGFAAAVIDYQWTGIGSGRPGDAWESEEE
jgi:hypothetical protein